MIGAQLGAVAEQLAAARAQARRADVQLGEIELALRGLDALKPPGSRWPRHTLQMYEELLHYAIDSHEAKQQLLAHIEAASTLVAAAREQTERRRDHRVVLGLIIENGRALQKRLEGATRALDDMYALILTIANMLLSAHQRDEDDDKDEP